MSTRPPRGAIERGPVSDLFGTFTEAELRVAHAALPIQLTFDAAMRDHNLAICIRGYARATLLARKAGKLKKHAERGVRKANRDRAPQPQQHAPVAPDTLPLEEATP
jgi:hypothetical protein